MFADNLKYLRKKFGYDQQKFGEMVGRGISTISEWESGKYTPKAKILTKITEIFNVSLDELLNSNLSQKDIGENTIKSTFGTILKTLRTEKRLTQKDLSSLTGFGQNTISQHENGSRSMGEQDIETYSKALGINPKKFLSIFVNRNDNEIDEETNSVINIMNKLTPSRRSVVKDCAIQQLNEQNKVINIANYKTTEIAVYGAVSAGRGEYLGTTNPEIVTIEGTAPEHDYAVRVNGDSMEPLFQNGQFIFVRKVDGDDEVRSNQIVVATFNGDAYVKKFIADPINNKCKLVSLNPEYADIEIHEYDEFDIIGIVVL